VSSVPRSIIALAMSALALSLFLVAENSADGADKTAATALPDGWSQMVKLESPVPNVGVLGESRLWVQDGWLLVERRSADDEVEWKVVLAKVVGGELPEVITDGLSLRLSYRRGRYFIRDSFGGLRCLREPKPLDEPWPILQIPDVPSVFGWNPKYGVAAGVIDSWFTVAVGPKRGAADAFMRLDNVLLREGGQRGYRAGRDGTGPCAIVKFGEMQLVADDELLAAEWREAFNAKSDLEERAKRLIGSDAPKLSGEKWFNADTPPSLRGKPVLLILLIFASVLSVNSFPGWWAFTNSTVKEDCGWSVFNRRVRRANWKSG
jgi:hypothetical protein